MVTTPTEPTTRELLAEACIAAVRCRAATLRLTMMSRPPEIVRACDGETPDSLAAVAREACDKATGALLELLRRSAAGGGTSSWELAMHDALCNLVHTLFAFLEPSGATLRGHTEGDNGNGEVD